CAAINVKAKAPAHHAARRAMSTEEVIPASYLAALATGKKRSGVHAGPEIDRSLLAPFIVPPGDGDSLALAVVLEALVILLDELLVTGWEFLLNPTECWVAFFIAERAPRALRAATMQPIHCVRVDPLAAAAGISALAALA